MDIFFSDPSETPLPRDEVRILDLKAEAYPDGRRVRVSIEITPFLEKPNGDIVITNGEGQCVAEASFIGTIVSKFDMTLHLRQSRQEMGEYRAAVTIFYTEEIISEGQDDRTPRLPEKMIVDEGSYNFMVEDDRSSSQYKDQALS